MSKTSSEKSVWYMNPFAGSIKEGNFGRPFFLSKSLRKFDINCRVITSSFHHQLRYPVDIKSYFYSDFIEDVPYTWVNTPRYQGNGLGRLKNMFVFAWLLWKHDLVKEKALEKPDVIIVSSVHPFHFFAGRKWAKKYGAKLIFEVRDIWPLSLTSLLGVNPLHPLVLLLGWIEKQAYKHSDNVVSLLPNAYLHMQTKGLEKQKFNYIPNGIYINSDSNRSTRHESYLNELKLKDKFIISYTGTHGVPNPMIPVLEAAKILKEKSIDNIALVLLGNGIEKPRLITFAQQNNLDNVRFLDSVPRVEVPAFLQMSDVCLVGGKNINLYKFGVSYNKLFEYMLASKPIIFTLDSPNNPVELAGCGICIKSDSPKKLAIAMEKISEMNIIERNQLGAKGHAYLLKEHTYDKLSKKYLNLF